MDIDDPDAATIGVAIEIPEPFRTQLRTLRERFGDPQAAMVPPHITLLPPVAVGAIRWSAALEHLASVAARHAPFRVELAGSDTFRPLTPVVFIRLQQGGDRCASLAAQVRTGPLDKSAEFDYHPHVTVAHHLDDEALDRAQAGAADYRAGFDCTAFQLFVWEDDGWHTYAHFDLTAQDESWSG